MLSTGSRMSNECSVTRMSRILYSTLVEVLGELHPCVQSHHFVRCHTCPALPMFSQRSGSWRSFLLPRLLCQPLERSHDETSAFAVHLKSTWG